MKNFKAAMLLCVLAGVGVAQAGPLVLENLGDLQVLDKSTNLVWASDWNLAGKTMTWSESNAWIADLNTANYAGHNDWRLPTANFSASSNCDAYFSPGGGFSD